MNTDQTIQWTRPVCQLDHDGIYIGQTDAELDVYAKDGSYLIPGGCVDTAPPEAREGHAARWNADTQAWDYLPDLRGQTCWRVADGLPVVIDRAGALDDLAEACGGTLTTEPKPSAYHEWNGSKWALSAAAKKRQLADAQAAAEAQINDAVYAVQQPLLRFRAEYELRESQARAFAAADYAGEVPSQVAAFATPTGKTPREAADIILAQAEMLHGALEQLGVLRMRKFELAALDNAEAVAGRTAEILAAVRGVAEQLQAAKG